MHIIHFGYDDWAGLYVDGELYHEGHRVDYRELQNASKGEPFTFEDPEANEEKWYELVEAYGGRLPNTWDDAKFAVDQA